MRHREVCQVQVKHWLTVSSYVAHPQIFDGTNSIYLGTPSKKDRQMNSKPLLSDVDEHLPLWFTIFWSCDSPLPHSVLSNWPFWWEEGVARTQNPKESWETHSSELHFLCLREKCVGLWSHLVALSMSGTLAVTYDSEKFGAPHECHTCWADRQGSERTAYF